MILVLSMLLITIVVFASVYLCLFNRLNDANGRIALLETKADHSEKSEKILWESVDLQTKCIRDLNDIVKKSVENKEPMEPDTKALLGGWIVEEPELPKKQPRPIDAFRMQKLISSLYCKNITPLYPWQQSELHRVLGLTESERREWNETIF